MKKQYKLSVIKNHKTTCTHTHTNDGVPLQGYVAS